MTEKTLEEILINCILDITDEYKGIKREEGIQVYLGYPQQLIDEITQLVKECVGKEKKINKKYSTDERRYPHGFNQAKKEIKSAFRQRGVKV